jgi:DNA invertase Pin-like site-specific DNA recombinase
VSEYERSIISLRLRSGRELKASRGGYAYGAPPLGFRSENRALVEDDAETRTVERVRQLHGDGLSLREIADALTAEGRTPKRSERWHPETLRRILARPTAA